MVCVYQEELYLYRPSVPCLLPRFDIELGFTPRPALLLLPAREAIFNQTHATSYLCLVILLTKFKGFLVSDPSLLPSVPPSKGSWSFIIVILS